MLSLESLKELAKEFQATEKNVVREYAQHLFLSLLYQQPESENLLFKGGTALRIIYGSPRFSEDLDFTGEDILPEQLDRAFLKVLSAAEKQGMDMVLKEAKPTSGGYLGLINYQIHDFEEGIKFDISLRPDRKANREVTTIVNHYVPSYTLISLSGAELVKEKISALLYRQKPRDYYDLYFILRNPLLRKFLNQDNLPEIKEILKTAKINFKEELGVLLPVSHHLILKDFKQALLFEIERF